MSKITCCPKCGGRIIVSRLYMYSLCSFIGRRGKLLNSTKRQDDGPLDQMLACCENYTNESCDVQWESDNFIIDNEGYFIDYKYT